MEFQRTINTNLDLVKKKKEKTAEMGGGGGGLKAVRLCCTVKKGKLSLYCFLSETRIARKRRLNHKDQRTMNKIVTSKNVLEHLIDKTIEISTDASALSSACTPVHVNTLSAESLFFLPCLRMPLLLNDGR